MYKPLLTNPDYAHLAYRKAIIQRNISFLRRSFIGDELTQPREVLVSEEVFPQDSKVPQEEVQLYVEHLNEELASIEVELRKYKLVAPGHHEQKSKKNQSKRHQESGQRNR